MDNQVNLGWGKCTMSIQEEWAVPPGGEEGIWGYGVRATAGYTELGLGSIISRLTLHLTTDPRPEATPLG